MTYEEVEKKAEMLYDRIRQIENLQNGGRLTASMNDFWEIHPNQQSKFINIIGELFDDEESVKSLPINSEPIKLFKVVADYTDGSTGTFFVESQRFDISEYFIVFTLNNNPIFCITKNSVLAIAECDPETKKPFYVMEDAFVTD